MTCSAGKKNVNILLTLKGKINIKKKKRKTLTRIKSPTVNVTGYNKRGQILLYQKP